MKIILLIASIRQVKNLPLNVPQLLLGRYQSYDWVAEDETSQQSTFAMLYKNLISFLFKSEKSFYIVDAIIQVNL